MTKVIIVGGGIIGLLTARELLAAGCQVQLIDKQAPGNEASWAGGGIVSPLYPWNYDDAISDLVRRAQAYYPQLCESLYQETGIDPEFDACGLFMLDSNEHAVALNWAQRTGAPLFTAPIAKVYQQIPGLRSGFTKALNMPQVGNVRNPRLLKALLASLMLNQHFDLVAGEAVTGLLTDHDVVVGTETQQQAYRADKVMIAAGAWTPLLTGAYGMPLKIAPVRGEMLVFEPKPGLLPSITLFDGKYLIPRKDGRIIVGSTTEQVGYCKDTTEKGRSILLAAAYGMLPGLRELRVEKHWAGLRPGSPAGLPYMGKAPDLRGLYVCAGHYRNGLVTAPASARLMADLILDRPSEINAEPFRLDRQTVATEMF